MNVKLLLLWLSLVFIIPAVAQEKTEDEEVFAESEDRVEEENAHALVPPGDLSSTNAYQIETVARRNFDETKWKEIVGDANFNEAGKDKKKENPKGELESAAPDLSMPWGGPVLRFVSYVIVTALAILLVYFIIRNISLDMHIQRSKVDSNDLAKPVENIERLDIETLLEKAVKEGDFKLAVRLYYLRLLKKLDAQGVISWKKDKTNREYLSELFARNFLFDEIRELTLSYESVWYGEHGLKSDTFKVLGDHFEEIHQRIETAVRKP